MLESKSIFDRWRNIVAAQMGVAADQITTETHLVNDLGADSLDRVRLALWLEDEFDLDEIPDDEVAKFQTVGDWVSYAERHAP